MNLAEIEHLKKLFAIKSLAELKNQEAVAKKIGVSQPTISRWKKDLEAFYMPETLFLVEESDGDGESWVPSDFLESLTYLLEGISERYHTLYATNTSKELTGTFKVYVPQLSMNLFGDNLMSALIDECPNVNWRVENIPAENIFSSVAEPDVAFAIHAKLKNCPSHIVSKKVIAAKRRVFVRKGHPILTHRDVSIDMLKEYPFTMIKVGVESGNGESEFDAEMHSLATKLLRLQPNDYKFVVESMNSCRYVMENHDAVTVGGVVYFRDVEGVEEVTSLDTELQKNLPILSDASSTFFYGHMDDPNLITWTRVIRRVSEGLRRAMPDSDQFGGV